VTDDAAALSIGDRDPDLAEILDRGLDEYNFAATGTSKADQDSFSIKASAPNGEVIGGLTAWTWAGLCGISMLWVHQDHRKAGWGAKILTAAETEARLRGCDRVCVSSFTFQAPGFYQKYDYIETGRTLGIPGGGEDVHMFKRLEPVTDHGGGEQGEPPLKP
jgi:ribosomal protein S18 acetylase RimI-like enzyme